TKYALGSVLNHVLLHQTIIGLEAKLQLAKVNEYPDVVVGCHGGGSNFGGIAFPFLMDVLAGDRQVRTVAIEPTACPTLTKGRFAYDYGDVAHLTPIAAMYTLGHDFMPAGIHAGGLRYHGASPLVSQLCADGFIEAKAVGQVGVFEAAQLFAQTEGIVPAPESAHAIKGAIDEALRCREEGKKETILFCLSGNGYLDLASYDAFLAGQLQDFEYPDKQLEESFAKLPKI
ncbi:MAG: pyridoxal-phosphate dependent enzyme, partial [Limnochordia bacterium]|nr:pyridoxal-phosphate dependent enzyme [Limnochordia bacterium]